ncbi:MAG TPA: ABC transporter ATP-binding protein [Patescibacteria group bacterium]|nr:ABC transporter ATP-binding protein [Patescibacteria group bacterium]
MSSKITNKHNLRAWLWRYFRRYWAGVLLLTIISFVIVGFQLLEPWPIKILVDSVFGTTAVPSFLGKLRTTDQLIILVAVSIVVIYGTQTILELIKHQFESWLALRMDFFISSDFFDRVQHLSLAALGRRSSGDFTYRQNAETAAVSSLLIGTINSLFKSVLTVLGIMVVMLTINVSLSIIGFLIIPFLYGSIRFFAHRIETRATAVEESNSKIYGYTTESVENVKLIQSFSKEKDRLGDFQGLLRLNVRFKLRYSLTDETFTLTNDTLATIAMAVLVVLGAHQVVGGELTVGGLLIFLTYLSYLYAPLEAISTSIGDAKADMASAKRVFAIFNREDIIKEVPSPIHINHARGHIEIRNVSFAYDKHRVLENVTLDIQPGQKVAIIGHSGSGKSSLLGLLPRFYDAQEGEILLDGVDISKLELRSLRRQFSIVSQEAPVLSTTITNNLAFAYERGLPREKDIVKATKAANAYDFITKLPHGFRTEVGERGGNLSGGQRQRLAIARAFLKDAPILLLDEPTSALDAKSEAAVVDALNTLMAGRTTLIVSHNAGTLRHADVIYVMKEGRIVQRVERSDTEQFKQLLEQTKEGS